MSGVRRSDTHVEYELDTATWMGPYAGTDTPVERVEEVRGVLVESGLEAEAFPDLLPAQWSKLIFNATVNTVAALTGLAHVGLFAREEEPTDLGHLVHELMDEGKRVAAAAGIALHEDPWEMNVLAVQRGETLKSDYAHVPSMLEDVLARRPHRGRLHHRGAGARGDAARSPGAAAHDDVPAREGVGGVVTPDPARDRGPRPLPCHGCGLTAALRDRGLRPLTLA